MNVERMLDEAKRGVSNALYCLEEKAEPDTVLASAWAAYAQATATTAQAMMGAEARQEWLEQRAEDYRIDVDDYRVSSH